jgi:hypothetical protein
MNDRAFWLVAGVLLLLFLKSKKRRQSDAKKIGPKTDPSKQAKTEAPAQKVKGWTAYRELLAKKESAGKYDARRPNSRYWGRYQLGPLARKVGGAQGVKWAQFKNDTALQDTAVKTWTTRLLKELKAQPLAVKAVTDGKATWAQLVAMDHLTGRSATMKWLRSGQITKDANKVSNLAWGKQFAQFNLTELERSSS